MIHINSRILEFGLQLQDYNIVIICRKMMVREMGREKKEEREETL